MESFRAHHDAIARPDWVSPPAAASLPLDRVQELWRLRGGHPRHFDEICVRDDATSKHFLQSFAIGNVPSLDYELHGTGRPTVTRMVGWLRARIDRDVREFARFADLESVHVDPSVDRMSVHAFLIRRMQHAVRRRARLAGLRVEVDPELTAYTRFYMELGFRESRDDELVWTPDEVVRWDGNRHAA